VDVSADDLKEVVKLRRLLRLRVWPSSGGNPAFLAQIPTLEVIELMLTDHRQSIEFASLPRLRKLSVQGLRGIGPRQPTNWRTIGLAHQRSLETVDMYDDQLGDAEMSEFDGLTRLHRLSLWLNENITSAGLHHLENTTELRCLEISQTQIDDAAMPVIGQMKMLSSLGLSKTRITDAGLESLKSLKSLHELDLDGTSVTDTGLESLKSLKNLHELDLDDTKVTDTGLESLKSLKDLQNLRLNGTSLKF
jgi:hypothetical protein